MIEHLLQRIAGELARCPFVAGVVLGGSRATGTATEASDIDIGIYYDGEEIDFDRLNEIAARLDDGRRQNLICREGGWGNWVNCGGWLTVERYHVDLILRETGRVRDILDRISRGDGRPLPDRPSPRLRGRHVPGRAGGRQGALRQGQGF